MLSVAASKVTLRDAKNRNELRYRELTKSVDQASLTRLFGSERVPWGLAGGEKKLPVPRWEQKDHETLKRIEALECLREMNKVREDVRHKLLNGRMHEIDPKYHLLKVQIYSHLDEKTRESLGLDVEEVVLGGMRPGQKKEINLKI